MRPYMLWLTRVYGGAIRGYGTAFMTWPNVLDDWLRRCAEDRYRNERARPREPRTSYLGRLHDRHMHIASENLRHEVFRRAEEGRARAAGQGGR